MSRRWRSILLVAAVILGPILLGAVWIEFTASRRWAETLKRTARIEKELVAPLPRRRPLRGEALPGNAWDDYAAANSLSRSDRAAERYYQSLEEARRRNSVPPPAAALAPAFARLREGVRKASADRPPGLHMDFWLFKAGQEQASLNAEAGRMSEAFEQLTDLLRVAQDWNQGPTMSDGNWHAFDAALHLLILIGNHSAPRADLEALLRELVLLEESIPPPGRFLLQERNLLHERLQKEPSFDIALPPHGAGWRHGWSTRLQQSRLLDLVEAWARSMATLQDRPWTEITRFQRQCREEAEQQGYRFPVDRGFAKELWTWGLRARLRVARAGAWFRATGERREMEDPFGGTLQWDAEGVRSRGATEDPRDDVVLKLKR